MKFSGAFLLALAAVTDAHYTFSKLRVNGKMVGRDWQYIRQHQRSYQPTKRQGILQNDFRCNQAAQLSAARTQVYTVKPGDKVSMVQAFQPNGMAHPGPAQVYMSRAPGRVQAYSGDGDWYKVYQSLLCSRGGAKGMQTNSWCSWMENSIAFTIPDTIPPGEYLARAEHIGLHGAHNGQAEFFYSCAQLKVVNSTASSIPGVGVKIPGVYKLTDRAINFNLWDGRTTYPTPPGPPVISGGVTRGSTVAGGKAA